MIDPTQGELHRLLHGELPAARQAALHAALARDPALAARWATLRAAWEELELPVSQAVPPGLRTRVLAAVAAEAARREGAGFGLLFASAGMRVVAATALVLGLTLGVVAGRGLVGTLDGVVPGVEVALHEPTLAEAWVEVLAAGDGEAGSLEP